MKAAHLLTIWPPDRLRGLAALLTLAVTTTLVGCDEDQARVPTHPAQGKVSFLGKPTPGAMIVLHPITASEPAPPKPTGYVDEQGNFVLNTYGGNDGAPEGEYDVTIQWPKLVQRDGEMQAGPNALPVRYGIPKDSKLTVKIAAGQNQIPAFELKR